MDEALIEILKEAKRQRDLNSWTKEYQPKQNQPDLDLHSSNLNVHHSQKNEADEQPLEIEDSDWEELLEEQRQFKQQRKEANEKLLNNTIYKCEILCQIGTVSRKQMQTTKLRLEKKANLLLEHRMYIDQMYEN